MRAFTKTLAGSMIAASALLVAACTSNETATENTTVVDVNTTDPMMVDGTTNDTMTAVDGAMGNDAMMANDTMGGDAATTNAM